MLRTKLERLFDEWRRSGDAAALAKVFDRTAPELSRLVAHLVRDPIEAEDVLQRTYLTAIERADTYDASRPLVPWLVGILANLARDSRKRTSRSAVRSQGLADAADSVVPEEGRGEADPAEQVAAEEFTAALARALDALPEPYREVLRLHLADGRRPVEIARTLGRPPGTIRMQVHRGLTMLRRALPAGFAASAAFVGLQPRGLAAVRARVLESATGSATIAGSVAIGPWILAAALTSVAAVGWLAVTSTGGDPPAATQAARLAPALPPDSDAELASRVQPVRSAVPAATSVDALASPGPARPAAMMLRGRVVGPLPAQMSELELTVRGAARFAWPEHVVARGRPDPRGVFEIDVGAIVRTAEGRLPLAGLVVSADHPEFVPAEVRVESPTDEAELSLERAGVVRGSVRRPAGSQAEVSVAALRLLDGVPALPAVEVTSCDAEGQFALRLRTSGEHVVVALAPGLAPTTRSTSALPGATRDLGVLELRPGASLEGLAVCGGAPLVGASLLARPAELAPQAGAVELGLLGTRLAWTGERFELAAVGCETGLGGGFRFDGLASGVHTLEVAALAGEVPVLPRASVITEARAPAAGLVVEVDLASVALTAQDAAGSPVAGRLFVGRPGEEEALPLGGAFAVGSGARCRVRVEGLGYVARTLVLDAPGAGETLFERIALTATASGRLELAFSAPVELDEVVLELQALDPNGSPRGAPESHRLAVQEGTVGLDVPVGRYRGAVLAASESEHYDAHLLPARFQLELTGAGHRESVDLHLGGRLRVEVTDTDGAPLAAECTLRDAGGTEVAVRFLAFRPERLRARAARLWAPGPNDVHPNLAAGEYELELSAAGFAPLRRWVRIERDEVCEVRVELVALGESAEPGQPR